MLATTLVRSSATTAVTIVIIGMTYASSIPIILIIILAKNKRNRLLNKVEDARLTRAVHTREDVRNQHGKAGACALGLACCDALRAQHRRWRVGIVWWKAQSERDESVCW